MLNRVWMNFELKECPFSILCSLFIWRFIVYISFVTIASRFHNSCIASYGLDPAYYYTLPEFTWNAMLKHIRVKFEGHWHGHFLECDICGNLSQTDKHGLTTVAHHMIYQNRRCTLTLTCTLGNVSTITIRFSMGRWCRKFYDHRDRFIYGLHSRSRLKVSATFLRRSYRPIILFDTRETIRQTKEEAPHYVVW